VIFRKKVLLIITILLSNLQLSAQESISFVQFLQELESKFDCKFSFKDSEVIGNYLPSFIGDNLDDALRYIDYNSLFNTTKIEGNIIAISLKENLIPICGYLNTQNNTSPFQGVVVRSDYQQTTTDIGGYFELLAKDPTDKITIQYTGYNTLIYPASLFTASPCIPIFMTQKIELLTTVNLQNYLAKGIYKDLDGALNVDYREFDILPGLIEPDVLLTLQALPGIQSVNETVSYINIRGGTNDQNLILWDGIKMYQSGHFFGLISAFHPQLTNKVTLIKNGTSASIGDGVSGVISMKSADDINTKFKGGAGINLLSTDAFVDVPLGSIGSIQVAGRKSMNDLFNTPTYNAYFEKAFQNTEVTTINDSFTTSDDTFQFYDTSIRALFQPTEKDRFRINIMLLGNSLEFLEQAVQDDGPQSLRSDLFQNTISGGLHYERRWGTNFTTEVQSYGTAYLLESTNYDILNNQRLLQKNKIEETGVIVKSNLQLSNNWWGSMGYQLNVTGITNFDQINNPFFERLDKQVIHTNSLFAETKFRPFANTQLNMGLRVNHVGKFNKWLYEPRLGFNHRFWNYFTFEVLAELKSQTTSQVIDFQTDFLGVENRRWILSKPDEIPILRSRQLSAGLTVNRKGWLLSVEPYLKEVDGITTQSQGFQNQFEEERTHGSYEVLGIDFLVNKRFRSLNTWMGYSYAKNNYSFPALSTSEFPNNLDIRHTLSFGADYGWKKLNLAAGINYHSGKPTTLLVPGEEVIDGELNFDAPNGANIDDYLRVDISATYRFHWDSSEWIVGASIWNLLNKANVNNHFFNLDDEGNFMEIDNKGLKFTPNISLRVLFQ